MVFWGVIPRLIPCLSHRSRRGSVPLAALWQFLAVACSPGPDEGAHILPLPAWTELHCRGAESGAVIQNLETPKGGDPKAIFGWTKYETLEQVFVFFFFCVLLIAPCGPRRGFV